MKVALCFWGICRSTNHTIESIHQYIRIPLLKENIEFDIYLHTYQIQQPYSNIRANELNIQLDNSLYKLLEPDYYLIENQSDVDKSLNFISYMTHGNPWKTSDSTENTTFCNHIRALWSLAKVTSLWTSSQKKYDRVIYLRPDVKFLKPIQIKWLYDVQEKEICIPNFHLTDDCNDRFAIGHPDVMKLYGNRFIDAYQYSLHYPLHSEKYLAYTLIKYGISIQHIRFRFYRVRADGAICFADLDFL